MNLGCKSLASSTAKKNLLFVEVTLGCDFDFTIGRFLSSLKRSDARGSKPGGVSRFSLPCRDVGVMLINLAKSFSKTMDDV